MSVDIPDYGSLYGPLLTGHEDLSGMSAAIQLARLPNSGGFGCVIQQAAHSGMPVAATSGTGGPDDPTAHSEMRAIRALSKSLGTTLEGYTLYSTHEPCMMCCGAINHAKISRVVFGSYRADLPHLFRPKTPAATLLLEASHPPVVVGGVFRADCIALLKERSKWD